MNLKEYQYLLSVQAIQQKSAAIFQLALENQTHFKIQLEKLNPIADWVIECIQKNYPQKTIPLHSRWRHFSAVNNQWHHFFETLPSSERAKAMIDLAAISVLLDAGAGSQWQYLHQGKAFTRSEALALATWDMFTKGLFSSEPGKPWQVDGAALINLDIATFSIGLQCHNHNMIEGLEGRWQLLKSYGHLLADDHAIFPNARIADLLDFIRSNLGDYFSASIVRKTGNHYPQ
ncbi:MAG: DUF1688 family protein [Proteobacteria bacterium]|nr:DUF1688 family protein [Pseudomonadota bacterium]